MRLCENQALAVSGKEFRELQCLADVDFLVQKLLVRFIGAGKFEGIRDRRFAFLYGGYHVRATKPMRLGVVGF